MNCDVYDREQVDALKREHAELEAMHERALAEMERLRRLPREEGERDCEWMNLD